MIAKEFRARYVLGILILGLSSISGLAQVPENAINELIESGYGQFIRDSSKALEIADSAFLESANLGYEEGAIRAKLLKAKIYGANQRIEDGISLLETILNNPPLSQSIEIESSQTLGHLYRLNNEYEKAITQDRKTIALTGTNPDFRIWKGKAEFNQGYAHKLIAQFDSAMAAYVRALKIFESIPDSSEMIHVYQQIGNLHLVNKNLGDAMEIFERNRVLIQVAGDSSDMATNVMNIGVVYQKRNESAKARTYYRKALAYSAAQKPRLSEAILYGNIGSSLMQEGRVEEGIIDMEKALTLKTILGANPTSMVHTLFDLSRAYRLTGDFSKSISLAEEIISIGKTHEDPYSTSMGYKYKSMAQYDQGSFKDAYDNYLLYTQLSDSIFSEQKAKQIKELEISYDTEKKDLAIASLEQEKLVEKARRQLSLIIGLALLLVGAIIYNQLRLRAKKNREILLKEQEVDRLKSDFFANVSHEFRTPLTLILGPIQSKLAAVTDYKEREELLMMQRNAMRLQHLINDILDLSKFEAGKLELQTSSTHISELTKGLAGTFTSLAEAKRIVFKIKVDAAIFGVVDKNKLETILINLLSNAFKYTPEGGEVIFSASAEEDELTCKVTDTGAGIPKEKLTKIFERFYQVDDSEGRKNEGTGIGLAFTKELVEMHSGELKVESTVGVGSTFSFSIPHHPNGYSGTFDEGLPVLEASEKLSPETTKKAHLDSDLPLILVVEDNADVRQYVHSVLADSYELVFAVNGQEGIEQALKIIPDLIVSDVMMPLVSGFELCAAVKTNVLTAHIPLILLTAKSSSESRIKGLETEADIYMAKPFNPTELSLQIRNLLSLKERLREKYQKDRELVIPLSVQGNSMEQKFLDRLEEVMASNFENPEFSAEMLSGEMNISRSQLHRKLKALTNDSTTQFIRTYRLKVAYQKLQLGTDSISAIAYDVGFNNVSYFNKCFKEAFGKQPSEITV